MEETIKKCIIDCRDCAQECVKTIAHCLKQGEEHASSEHINILLDCVGICQLNADYMLRESKYHKDVSSISAKICRDCAQSCKRITPTDEVMRACADSCERCADSCEQIISQ